MNLSLVQPIYARRLVDARAYQVRDELKSSAIFYTA